MGSVGNQAGDITLNATGATTVAGSYVLNNTVDLRAIGNAGNINVTARSLSLSNGAYLGTTSYGPGNAGSVSVQVADSVLIANSQILSNVALGAVGDAGKIDIRTGSLSLTDSVLSANTGGRGDASDISVWATDSVSLTYSLVASSVFTEAIGNGGNISVKARSLSLTNGASVLVSTSGQGNAGNVIIEARDTVSLDGVSSDRLSSAVFSTVEQGAVGNGGGINITAGSLSVTNGAKLIANSEGIGAAGNIGVTARSIRLDNQAVLSSDTTAGQGNIFLDSQDLVLRRGSNITTDATGTATGGNITIDADVIVALENSDISAKASEGPGGRIIINATGIFGTEFRKAETEESDITASSNLGPQFSGTVEINTPDVDTSLGLVTLPTELVETSRLIATGCADVGENKFIITGRGGLPPNPGDPLIGEAVLTNWATLDPEVENRSGADTTNPTRENAPTQIVEAQGWVINNKGEVVLTAHAPNVTPNIPWLTPATCYAPETES